MQKNNCIGCKSHFEEGTKLPLEGMNLQLKNYPLPIKQQKHKWNLLRTICSFLNSKGGTIFIGAQDSGQIRGYNIQRKQQDDFKIFIQQLTQRIVPKIDLSDREDIFVQFLPVLTNGKFLVVVKQGQPSQLYCFSQKIQLQAANQKKTQQYEIIYSYLRQNSSTIKQYKGFQLLNLAKTRAAKPPKATNCFHQNCNPQPLDLNIQILKIGFSHIQRQTRQILEQWCQVSLSELNIKNPIVSFDRQNDMIVVEFISKSDFDKAQKYVSKNLNEVNKSLEGHCKFVKKDSFLDCLVYENVQKHVDISAYQNFQKKKKEQNQQKRQKNNEGQKKKKYVKVTTPPQQQKVQVKAQISKKQDDEWEDQYEQYQQQKETAVEIKKSQKKRKQKNQQQFFQKQSKREKKKSQGPINQKSFKSQLQKQQSQTHKNVKSIGKKHSLTFTHINPKTKDNLVTFLNSLTSCKKNFQVYENTIQVFLPNQDYHDEFYMRVIEESATLNTYGFKNQIKFGENCGQIDVHNFDRQKGQELLKYLRKVMGKDLNGSQINRYGKNYTISLGLSRPAACKWLDRLLVDGQIKSFQIPGADKGQKAKMKIHLICMDPLQMGQLFFMN